MNKRNRYSFSVGFLLLLSAFLLPVFSKGQSDNLENRQDSKSPEQILFFKILDEQGLEKSYISIEERLKIEKKINEYKRNKETKNEADIKMYIINDKYEVIGIENIKQ